jgi:hypothetical protein
MPVRTRSQAKQSHVATTTPIPIEQPFVPCPPLFEVDIDFDAASEAWRANKKSIGNGSYKYICTAICKSGKPCSRKPIEDDEFCKIHGIRG